MEPKTIYDHMGNDRDRELVQIFIFTPETKTIETSYLDLFALVTYDCKLNWAFKSQLSYFYETWLSIIYVCDL